jgi:hypothetical protein
MWHRQFRRCIAACVDIDTGRAAMHRGFSGGFRGLFVYRKSQKKGTFVDVFLIDIHHV